MIPKSGYRFPAFAKPASAGEGKVGKDHAQTKNQGRMTIRRKITLL
jgi:hypothetical protein